MGLRKCSLDQEPQFSQAYAAMSATFTDIFGKARLVRTLSTDEREELAETAISVAAGETGVFSYMTMIYNTDDYIFRHSASVGVLAGLIGKWLGKSGGDLRELILAGFLHDVGKAQIPQRILNKPGQLDESEREVVRQHPSRGFDVLQSPLRPSQAVLSVVLQHHERIDGSGYPGGLSGEQIAPAARIVAIADIYDAMISDRSYRPAETPFRAVEEIHRQMFGKLDPKLCNIFISKARKSFIGMGVRLSDGSEATVVAMDQSSPATPVVCSKTGCYTNLAQSELTITGVVPEG